MFTLVAIVCCNLMLVLFLLQDPLFVGRVFFDLFYFFFIIIIVLNLILGVIIDTFAALRSEKQEKEDILNNSCFICGKISEELHTVSGHASLCIITRDSFTLCDSLVQWQAAHHIRGQ